MSNTGQESTMHPSMKLVPRPPTTHQLVVPSLLMEDLRDHDPRDGANPPIMT
jgi:hypothetical protein